MKTITQKELNEILDLHKKWLNDEDGGKCANLSNVDLSDVDLSGAILVGAKLSDANLLCAKLRSADLSGVILVGTKLRGADLSDADLTHANLQYADLSNTDLSNTDLIYADLSGAILRGAKLRGADLNGADLTYANLRYADLTHANLRYADLKTADLSCANITNVTYDEQTAFFALQCPEEGSFIGYKKAKNFIVKLLITEDAKRSSATTRKCRCSKAKVLSITNLDGSESKLESICSKYDKSFIYKVGEIVEVPDFDEDRWNECSTGIHFFITRNEAVQYN